jgi:purine-binding chemotaxis protein CheW
MYNDSTAEAFIVFKIANYPFALPIRNVLQVVNFPSQQNFALSQVGLVQLGQHMVRVVDLHQYLNLSNFSLLPENRSFLVILRDPQGGFCGILVHEPPDLIEFSPGKLRSLSHSERQFGLAKIASHTTVLNWKELPTTVFLLDLQQALATTTGLQLLPA